MLLSTMGNVLLSTIFAQLLHERLDPLTRRTIVVAERIYIYIYIYIYMLRNLTLKHA